MVSVSEPVSDPEHAVGDGLHQLQLQSRGEETGTVGYPVEKCRLPCAPVHARRQQQGDLVKQSGAQEAAVDLAASCHCQSLHAKLVAEDLHCPWQVDALLAGHDIANIAVAQISEIFLGRILAEKYEKGLRLLGVPEERAACVGAYLVAFRLHCLVPCLMACRSGVLGLSEFSYKKYL